MDFCRSSGEMLTFSVIAEAHLGLAETNCVFSLGNAIELLKLYLGDTLNKLPLAFSADIRGIFLYRVHIPEKENKSQSP